MLFIPYSFDDAILFKLKVEALKFSFWLSFNAYSVRLKLLFVLLNDWLFNESSLYGLCCTETLFKSSLLNWMADELSFEFGLFKKLISPGKSSAWLVKMKSNTFVAVDMSIDFKPLSQALNELFMAVAFVLLNKLTPKQMPMFVEVILVFSEFSTIFTRNLIKYLVNRRLKINSKWENAKKDELIL